MTDQVVGRDSELGAIDAFFARPVERAAGFVLEGELGIGKSTLWRVAVEAARERGYLVLVSRPAEPERGLAYVGLGDLFENQLEYVLPRLSSPRRRALEAALLVEEAASAAVDTRALAIAVRDVLQALAEQRPAVVAIDDVQWFDAASTSALAFALRRVDPSPVRLLLARRTANGAQPSELEQAVGVDDVEHLSLGPFSLGALHAFLRNRLDRVFPRQTLLRIHEQSGGNPFFALELARGLGPDIDPTKPLPVPETLEELVRARLAGLPTAARAALGFAAALGTPSWSLLVRAGVDAYAVDAAVDAQVLERDNGTLRFTHPLLSSVLYADLADDRTSVHRRIAEIVDDPIVRARHLALATEVADSAVAEVVDQAVRTATKRGASAVAAELAEHAIRLTPADAREDVYRRGLAAARAHQTAGDWVRAHSIADDLLATVPPGPERAEVLVLLASLETENHAAALAEQALEEASGSPALLSTIHTWLAFTTRFRDGFLSSLEHGRTALAFAEEADDDALRVDALMQMTINGCMIGEPEAKQHAARAYELATTLGDETVVKRATITLAAALMDDRAHLDTTRELLERAEREWRERDEPFAAQMLWYLAWVEFWSGRWELAADHAARQQEIRVPYGVELTLAYVPVIWIAVHRGELELARTVAEDGLALAREQLGLEPPSALAVLGLAALWSGDAPAAVERLGKADAVAHAIGWREPHTRMWTADYAEALITVGRVDEAVELLDRWQADTALLEREWVVAQIVRSRGLVAAARGDVAGAVTLLEQAVARHEANGDAYGHARALLALGIVRRRGRQKRSAREAIEAALETFDRIGAAGWAAKARGELGRIGGRTREHGLTPAERRVAALVVEGRTNREVAAALFLGERTVEAHLSHVYAKLGVRSRTELARKFRPDEQSSGELTISS